jgi:hypothetical protein
MASIGKKILSAFVEIPGEEKSPPVKPAEPAPDYSNTGKNYIPSAENSVKFKQYFDKLFKDANMPGPDYFEFSKMIEAMNTIPDERSRYSAAFAGLSVQGLDKSKLLSTAAEYLRVLDTDAINFSSSVDAALQEKVHARKKEIADKTSRIEQLSKEISELHRQIASLDNEIKENEEKIESNNGGYKAEFEKMKIRILNDMEKIKQHIH